jgi:glycerol-3-phosphate cytidylyltransferase
MMPEKIGFTCSTFDLFHSGHVLMLKEAKELCDYLIVGLQVDPSVDRPEKNKPIQTMFERFTQLSACKYVDEIVPYSTEADLLNLLQSVNIHIRILGEEYRDKDFTGKDLPMEFYFNSRRHNFSTTELRDRVVQSSIRPRF